MLTGCLAGSYVVNTKLINDPISNGCQNKQNLCLKTVMNCQILVCLQFVILANLVLCNSDSLFETSSANSSNKQCGDLVFCKEFNYGPHSPYVPCSYLPLDFLECDELQDHQGNISSLKLAGHGCLNFGGQNHNGILLFKLSIRFFFKIKISRCIYWLKSLSCVD